MSRRAAIRVVAVGMLVLATACASSQGRDDGATDASVVDRADLGAVDTAATDARVLDATPPDAAMGADGGFDAARDAVGDARDGGHEAAADAATPYLIGTLQSQCSHARELYAAGARVATLEMNWGAYEGHADNDWQTAYIAAQRTNLQCFVDLGFRVILGLGTQYEPSWLGALPNAHHRNQYGDETGVNLTFNSEVRRQFDEFTQRVAHDLDLSHVWAVRLGSGTEIEALLPTMTFNGRTNGYWAYDVNAQGTGPQRVASVGVDPYVGWQPGQHTWNGMPFTAAMAARWLDWYVAAMADGINAQIASLRRAGFTGHAQVLMPGIGALPSYVNRALPTLLDGSTDGLHVIGRAAAWHLVAAHLVDDAHATTLYCSSMADGSGGDSLCTPADATMDYTTTPSLADHWSATRWVAYLAHRHGNSTMGENPGRADSHGRYGTTMLQTTAALMQSCGQLGFAWAHEFELYDATSGVTVSDFGHVIHLYDP